MTPLRLSTAAALLSVVVAAPAAADDAPGLRRFAPVLSSAVAPVRQALIAAPGRDTSPDTERLLGDAAAYRDLLRLLGFEVSMLDVGTRPDLDSGLRDFGKSVRRDADVAVFLLGNLRPSEGGLALMPAGSAVDAQLVPERAESEGVRPAGALRRAVESGSRVVVLITDACVGSASVCADALAALPVGVSALAARRAPVSDAASPGGSSLRRALLPAMQTEGMVLPQLYGVVANGLKTTNLGLVATAALNPSFAFLPAGFLEGLPLACNSVEPDLGADALRSRPTLEPLVAACGDAAARYDFSPVFKAKLATVRDQEAARKALVSCAEAAAYLDAFPDGRYRSAVEAHRRACAAQTVPPQPVLAPAPTPPPAATALSRRAADAVVGYFHRHDYAQGDSFGALARLYAPQVRVRGAVVSAAQHLRAVGGWYGAFDQIRFLLVPDSLDLSGCVREDDCAARGRYSTNALRAGETTFEHQERDFVLRFDLRAGQVLAECGVTDPPRVPAAACD